jgi:hypothetical protein
MPPEEFEAAYGFPPVRDRQLDAAVDSLRAALALGVVPGGPTAPAIAEVLPTAPEGVEKDARADAPELERARALREG